MTQTETPTEISLRTDRDLVGRELLPVPVARPKPREAVRSGLLGRKELAEAGGRNALAEAGVADKINTRGNGSIPERNYSESNQF